MEPSGSFLQKAAMHEWTMDKTNTRLADEKKPAASVRQNSRTCLEHAQLTRAELSELLDLALDLKKSLPAD